MSGNPFDYQNPTRPEHFLDRQDERERLARHIADGINLLVYGPRRRGKTSLITWVFESLRDPVPIYADATRMRHPGDLGNKILAGLAGSGIAKLPRLQKWATDQLHGLDIELGASRGGVYIRLRHGTEATTGLIQALEFLERIGHVSKRRFVVCLDEFQVAMDHEGVVDAIRSVAQHQRHVQYVFSGSEPTILANLNQDDASPFYQQLLEMRMRGLRIQALRSDAERLLTFPLADDAVARIDEVLGDDTKRIIHVLRHVWEQGHGGLEAVDASIAAAMSDMSDTYESKISQIQSLQHRRVLLALAEEGTEHPTALGFIRKHGLHSPAHVGRALAALKRIHVLDDDNAFRDGLFRHFLRQS